MEPELTVAVLHHIHRSTLLIALAASLAACSSLTGSDDDDGGLFACSQPGTDPDPRCNTSMAGTVGTGPKFTGGLTTTVRHGFVTGDQLVLAVELTASDDTYGGIFSIDLKTGNRTLLSGKYKDPVTGDLIKGAGPAGKSLNQVRDVALGPNNTYYALAAQNLQASRIVYAIDPASGDQRVIFDSTATACTGITGVAQVSFDPDSGLTIGSDGAIYLVLNNIPQGSGKGVARIGSDGKCSVVSLSGATATADNHGGGPDIIGTFLYNLTFRDNLLAVLQFNTHSSIITIDPATGNRTMVSVSPDKGMGPDLATDSMTIAPDGTYWTYHGQRNGVFGLVSVDPATGNRTAHEAKAGPLKKEQGPDRGIWAHPDGKHILMQYANAILIFDPASGNSNTLSY